MKTKVIVAIILALLPLAGRAEEPAVGGKPTAGAGVNPTPSPGPHMSPASVPGVNDPNHTGMGTGSGKGSSGNGSGAATQGGTSSPP